MKALFFDRGPKSGQVCFPKLGSFPDTFYDFTGLDYEAESEHRILSEKKEEAVLVGAWIQPPQASAILDRIRTKIPCTPNDPG